MKDKTYKKAIFYYAYNELDQFETFLEDKAAHGWMLTGMENSSSFIFVRCEPLVVRFSVQLIKTPEGNYQQSEQVLREYVAERESEGWHHAAFFNRLQVFYTSDAAVAAIQSDQRIKLSIIARRIIGHSILMTVGGALILLFDFFLWTYFFENRFSYFNFSAYIIAIALTIYGLVDLIRSHLWYVKNRRYVLAGQHVQYSKVKRVRGIFIGGMFLIFAIGLSIMAYFGFAFPPIANISACLATAILGLILLSKFALPSIWQVINESIMTRLLVMAFYLGFMIAFAGNFWPIGFQYDLPVSLYDLGVVSSESTEQYYACAKPGLIYRADFSDHLKEGALDLQLDCKIVKTPFDSLLTFAQQNYFWLDRSVKGEWQAVSLDAFGAKSVYRAWGEAGHDRYLVVYDDTILQIWVNWDLSEEQIQAIGENMK